MAEDEAAEGVVVTEVVATEVEEEESIGAAEAGAVNSVEAGGAAGAENSAAVEEEEGVVISVEGEVAGVSAQRRRTLVSATFPAYTSELNLYFMLSHSVSHQSHPTEYVCVRFARSFSSVGAHFLQDTHGRGHVDCAPE